MVCRSSFSVCVGAGGRRGEVLPYWARLPRGSGCSIEKRNHTNPQKKVVWICFCDSFSFYETTKLGVSFLCLPFFKCHFILLYKVLSVCLCARARVCNLKSDSGILLDYLSPPPPT